MKRILALLLLISMSIAALAALYACNGVGDNSSSPQISDTTEESTLIPDEKAKEYWSDSYKAQGFSGTDDIFGFTPYEYEGDKRYLFTGRESTRAVVCSEGYAVTLPGTDVTADFTLGALRSKYKADKYVLTVTYEDQNPYGNTADKFAIYFDEWLTRYLENVDFLAANTIRRTRKVGVTEELLPGFTVNYYDMQINLASKLEYDCYSIAVVRPKDKYDYFWLFVMKSGDPMPETLDSIVASFTELEKNGTPKNTVGSYELRAPDYWSDETKAYFEKLQNQTSVDFGCYYAQNDAEYIKWLQSDEALAHQNEIFMTYYHIGWYDTKTYVDLDLLRSNAGGNGFNGKPVLEFTYQFTTTNNLLGGYTPMYDILRGKLDDHFRKLAQDIKEYGKPVLFRLNNEMNTDWTSYCGMVTMLDPDIFIETWRRLYDIFREEGVDNCIWIFNPIATSCPYSNWGDMLNYFPGEDYVQMIGLTSYQMNNDDSFATFREMYTELYKKNTPYFDNYPAIIGEFGCGAGGEVIYNWDKGAYVPVEDIETKRVRQAEWIKGMFECFAHNTEPGYEFCRNIKIAVWFSANDYAEVNGETKVLNYIKLDDGVPLALKALREGLAAMNAEK